jgi:hypothetical protein
LDRCIPRTAQMRRISYEVVQKIPQLNEWHVVLPLLVGTMRLGWSMQPGVRQTINEANAVEIVRKRRSRPPVKNVITMLSVVGLTQRAFPSCSQGINCGVPDVGKHGRLANLCYQRCLKVPTVQRL